MKFLITAKSINKDNIELTVASEDIDIFPRPVTKVISFNDTLTIEIPEIKRLQDGSDSLLDRIINLI